MATTRSRPKRTKAPKAPPTKRTGSTRPAAKPSSGYRFGPDPLDTTETNPRPKGRGTPRPKAVPPGQAKRMGVGARSGPGGSTTPTPATSKFGPIGPPTPIGGGGFTPRPIGPPTPIGRPGTVTAPSGRRNVAVRPNTTRTGELPTTGFPVSVRASTKRR